DSASHASFSLHPRSRIVRTTSRSCWLSFFCCLVRFHAILLFLVCTGREPSLSEPVFPLHPDAVLPEAPLASLGPSEHEGRERSQDAHRVPVLSTTEVEPPTLDGATAPDRIVNRAVTAHEP